MKKVSKEESSQLFTIEKISLTPMPIKVISGCALCEHCSILRFLSSSSVDKCKSVADQQKRIV
jgi:hypothetical protein